MHRILIFFLIIFLALTASADLKSELEYYRSNIDKFERPSKEIEALIQKVVVYTIMEETQDVLNRLRKHSDIKLLPNSAYQVVQQTAVQVYQQDLLKDYAHLAFYKGVEAYNESRAQGLSGTEIQEAVKNVVNNQISEIVQDPIYQEVMKIMIQNGMKMDRMYLAQVSMRQRMQAAAKARQKNLKKQLEQETKNAMDQVLSQYSILVR